MADNEHNDDEYKFEEFDLDNDSDIEQLADSDQSKYSKDRDNSEGKNTIRNALIVLGLIVFAVIAYKLVGWMLSGKKNVASIPPVVVEQSQPAALVPKPELMQETQPNPSLIDTDLKQRVSLMEQSLQTIKADVSSVQEQINTVNSNLNALNTQITTLNQTVTNLAEQVAKQSEVNNTLIVKQHTKSMPKPKRLRFGPVAKATYFYIQAVIPGRAWIIDSNGTTLTVREGTKIPNYGVVKLIDSMQGRVLTSSGRVIRFSQDDS